MELYIMHHKNVKTHHIFSLRQSNGHMGGDKTSHWSCVMLVNLF